MTTLQILAVVGLLAFVPLLYGLHRLALWLEARGHLFYKHRQPESSPASCFAAVQRFVEPGAQHVHVIKEQRKQDKHNGEPAKDEEAEPS